jgi:hypothetical protein
MKRFHVHVAVDDLAQGIRFYSAMFATEPSVQKPDYAKWMLNDPRVNFAISQHGAQHGLNHLGIQVESDYELRDMQSRLESLQPDIAKEEDVPCCYAKSDKYWINDPAGIAWETFHTLGTIPIYGNGKAANEPTRAQSACCTPLAMDAKQADALCCMPIGKQAAVAGKCC